MGVNRLMYELNIKRLLAAAEELRYLLDRGYPRDGALNFVANHHRLDKKHKIVLLRSVYSSKEVEERKRKTVPFQKLKGNVLSVDGYNVLIVLETMLRNQPLLEGDDGYVRDISGVHGKHKLSNHTIQAVNILLEELKKAQPREVLIFFDSPVSKSGELAGTVRNLMKTRGVKGDSVAVSQADNAVIRTGEIALTSDSVILQKARKCFDIAGHIARKRGYAWIISFKHPP